MSPTNLICLPIQKRNLKNELIQNKAKCNKIQYYILIDFKSDFISTTEIFVAQSTIEIIFRMRVTQKDQF